MSDEISPQADQQSDKLAFLVAVSEGVHENIKFADTKAAVLITLNAGLIAGLYGAIDPTNVHVLWAGLLVCFVLAVSIAIAFGTIWPRGDRNARRGAGLVDAIRIAQLGEERFVTDYIEASPSMLLQEMAVFLHDRAYIDKRKYQWLRVALVIAAIGWLLALAFAAGLKISGIAT